MKVKWRDHFKVCTWDYSLKGPGFALICLNFGSSHSDWFKTRLDAELKAQQMTEDGGCTCSRKCIDIFFERNILNE